MQRVGGKGEAGSSRTSARSASWDTHTHTHTTHTQTKSRGVHLRPAQQACAHQGGIYETFQSFLSWSKRQPTFYLFICSFFLVVLGLCCCMDFFSSSSERGLLGFLIVMSFLAAEHGLSGTWASVAAAHGLSSCGSRAPEHRLNSCGIWAQLLYGMWDLPRPGIEPVSPALTGGFFTTEPLFESPWDNSLLKRWTEFLNPHFTKEGRWMVSKHMEGCSTSVVIREMQIKTTMNWDYTPIRMAKI